MSRTVFLNSRRPQRNYSVVQSFELPVSSGVATRRILALQLTQTDVNNSINSLLGEKYSGQDLQNLIAGVKMINFDWAQRIWEYVV